MRNAYDFEYYHGHLQSERFGISILIILWAILQIVAYFLFEMRSSVDSELYIGNAIKLTQGVFPSGREVYYVAYSALIAIPIVLGLNRVCITYSSRHCSSCSNLHL